MQRKIGAICMMIIICGNMFAQAFASTGKVVPAKAVPVIDEQANPGHGAAPAKAVAAQALGIDPEDFSGHTVDFSGSTVVIDGIEYVMSQDEQSNSTGDILIQKKADAINDFREAKMDIITDIYRENSMSFFIDINDAKQQLDNLSDEFHDLSKEYNQVKTKRSKVLEKYTELQNVIDRVLTDTKNTQNMVDERLIKMRLYSKKLIQLKEELTELSSDLDLTKSTFIKYTNALYKINNDFYGQDLNIDNIKLLVKSENIADSLNSEDVTKALALKMQDLLELLSIKHEKVIAYTKKLNTLRVKYKYEVKQYGEEVKNLEEQKRYLSQLLRFLQRDKAEIDDRYQSLLTNRKIVKDQIVNIIAMTRQKADSMDFNNVVDRGLIDLMKTKDKDDGDKFFSWPVLPVRKITAYYDDPDYGEEFGVLHKGIDISVSQGSTVYAPANGVVYKVIDNDTPWVNRLIIVHKYGYVTVYLHMNRVVVNEGDFVKRGQIIGISGGKPGTRGAGMLSTGPHLHFEIIKNGSYVDPMSVMDLSIFNARKYIDEKYHFKFIKDKFSRNIDLTDVEYIQASTLDERRSMFLEKYAFGPFKDLELWEKAVEGLDVDIDMGICIGFSETGLGHNMVSKWNIGNVGNNDRGDRRGYDEAFYGARAIYRALTNEYLSKNRTLDQMSRYGNKEGSIYASSDYNWEKNMVKCLSKIKGYRVPEDYPFRSVAQEHIDNNIYMTEYNVNAADEVIKKQVEQNKVLQNSNTVINSGTGDVFTGN